jgi:hypothetical protein
MFRNLELHITLNDNIFGERPILGLHGITTMGETADTVSLFPG